MGDWRSFKFTHDESGVTYEEGKLYKIGDTIGVLFLDVRYDPETGAKLDAEIEKGDEGVLVYHIEKVMLKKTAASGEAFLPGDKIWWSGTQGDPVTPNHTTGYYWIGIATEPATWNATEVEADLKGDKVSITEPL